MAADLEHLHPIFRERVLATKIAVLSGARSTQRQRELYQMFLNGKGNPANPPGTSWHEWGDGIPGGYWALAVDFYAPYPHHAPGLCFPIKGEPWHAQPIEVQFSSRRAGAEKLMPPIVVPTPYDPWDDLFVPILVRGNND